MNNGDYPVSGIADSIAVVTGAAGGIGHATSVWLADHGAVVYELDQRPPDAPEGIFIDVDLLDEKSVLRAFADIARSAGRIDSLVAAAGVSEEPTPAEDMDIAVWDRTIGINLRGVFLSCQAAGRVMLSQGAGRIVTVASMSGNHVVNTPQQQVAYNSSKAAVVAMAKSLAYEWAGRGVRVNTLSPGYVDTALLGSKHVLHEEWKKATPVRRFASPAETASAIGYLLSDDAAYFCGAELLMDGGYSLA